MKSRNREVNIFNMSLLDILCGALGAFCFMMLVLFPYWKPKGATAEDLAKKYQEVSREMDQIRKELEKVPGSGDLKERLDKVTKNYQQQQRELEKARREAQEAKQENDQLRMRRPMAVTMTWSSSMHKVDLYVRFRGKAKDGSEMPPPDASKSQGILFTGDLVTDCYTGPCTDAWIVRDVPLGSEFEVHYKFMDANGNPGPARINAAFVNHQGGFWSLPVADIPRPNSSVFVGVLNYNVNGKLIFRPQPEFAASFQERNKERLAALQK